MVKKSATSLGIYDGIVNAAILFVLREYICSGIYSSSSIVNLIVISVVIFISVILFLFGASLIQGGIIRYYAIGRLTLVISLIILLLNDLTLHIHLLPHREIANADGLLMLAIDAVYLLATELLRLLLTILIDLRKKH